MNWVIMVLLMGDSLVPFGTLLVYIIALYLPNMAALQIDFLRKHSSRINRNKGCLIRDFSKFRELYRNRRRKKYFSLQLRVNFYSKYIFYLFVFGKIETAMFSWSHHNRTAFICKLSKILQESSFWWFVYDRIPCQRNPSGEPPLFQMELTRETYLTLCTPVIIPLVVDLNKHQPRLSRISQSTVFVCMIFSLGFWSLFSWLASQRFYRIDIYSLYS